MGPALRSSRCRRPPFRSKDSWGSPLRRHGKNMALQATAARRHVLPGIPRRQWRPRDTDRQCGGDRTQTVALAIAAAAAAVLLLERVSALVREPAAGLRQYKRVLEYLSRYGIR